MQSPSEGSGCVPITRRKPLTCVWMSLREAANYTRVHHTTVRRWIHNGLLTAYKPGDLREWRLCRDDIDVFMKGTSAGSRATIRRHEREVMESD